MTSPATTTAAVDEALVPLAADRRVFRWHDHAALWFSLGVGLLVLSLVWLSWQFLALAQSQGLNDLWQRRGSGGMDVMPALDLVIAMPMSWLPLVADYARHGTHGCAALRGTWLGYALANIWCYALGVLVALVLPSQDLVTALLLAQGGLVALSLILIDGIDNAYGDTYSGAVSAHALQPRWSVRRWGPAMALLCTALAPVLGSALPTLVLCFVLAFATRLRVQPGAGVLAPGAGRV